MSIYDYDADSVGFRSSEEFLLWQQAQEKVQLRERNSQKKDTYLTDDQIDKLAFKTIPISAYMGMFEHAKFTKEDCDRIFRLFARSVERTIKIQHENL